MGFEAVDRGERPERYVDYLAWADAHPAVRAYKARALETLQRRGSLAGLRALDVGCGRGTDLERLARALGPRGRAVGLDSSQHMLSAARSLYPHLEFVHGRAEALPFPDASFDLVRVDRVLIHLARPEAALAELARVLRPGGRALLTEGDFSALHIEHPDLARTRRVLRHLGAADPRARIGAELGRRLAAAGLRLVYEERHELVFRSFGEAEAFLLIDEALQRAVAAGDLSLPQALVWRLELQRTRPFRAALPGHGLIAVRP